MLKVIKGIFESWGDGSVDEEDSVGLVPLAVAALLFEICRSDDNLSKEEMEVVAHSVEKVCDVPGEQVTLLLAEANSAVENAVSLYDFTSVLNEKMTSDQKYEVLVLMWRVAYADGRLDHYEEYFIRKIAELLHLSQSQFIKAKHHYKT